MDKDLQDLKAIQKQRAHEAAVKAKEDRIRAEEEEAERIRKERKVKKRFSSKGITPGSTLKDTKSHFTKTT